MKPEYMIYWIVLFIALAFILSIIAAFFLKALNDLNETLKEQTKALRSINGKLAIRNLLKHK